MKMLIKYRLILIGIVIGAIGGYIYYRTVGCSNETCLITANPVNSTVYGAVMGGLFFDLFRKKEVKPKSDQNDN